MNHRPAGTLHSVRFDRSLLHIGFVILLPILAGLLLPIGIVVAMSVVGRGAAFIVVIAYFPVLVAIIVGALLWTRRVPVNRMLATVHEFPAVEQIERLVPRLRRTYPQGAVRKLLAELCRRGARDVTVRVASAKDIPAEPLTPIDVPFEPRPLADCHDTDASTVESETGQGAIRRRIRRNLFLKGGKGIVLAFGALVIIYALESYKAGRPTVGLYAWTIALVALLLAPVRTGGWRFRPSEWLVAPGGLIRRRGSPWSTAWSSHVFDRERSVLVAFRYYRNLWMVVVADERESDLLAGTRDEIDFVLRAWLSPIAPPAAELVEQMA